MTTVFKTKVLEFCREKLRQNMQLLSAELGELSESLTSETKSSMGDKHETSRSRMQADFEKLSFHLSDIREQYKQLQAIDIRKQYSLVAQGCLVITSQRIFFIVVPLGKIVIDEKEIFVISTDSPIGTQLMGKKTNDVFNFNGISYKILDLI